jgi:hypothetical protein
MAKSTSSGLRGILGSLSLALIDGFREIHLTSFATQERISKGIHGLAKVWLGPAMAVSRGMSGVSVDTPILETQSGTLLSWALP